MRFLVLSRLVAKRLDVYTPVVDVGIDCIVRKQGADKVIKYYEFQVKGARYKDLSIRGGRRILEFTKNTNYYLIVPIRRNGEYEEIIYLDANEVEAHSTREMKNGEIDVRIGANEKDSFIKNHRLDAFLEKISHE
jgi:hypothetical protein